MKLKNLLPLAIVFVVLIVLVVVRKSGEQELTLTEEVRLQSMIPENLQADDIAKLELFAGANPDEKVELVRVESEGRWRVPSHYNAPVKQDRIDKFLNSLVTLDGEFRAHAESDDALAAYDLRDEDSFQIAGYTKDSDEAAFHILVGKTPAYGNVFIRAAGSNDVNIGNVNFRQEVGLYTPDKAASPKADIWLDKQVVALEREKINKIELAMPDKSVTFEKRGKPQEEVAEGETPPPVEYEWALASGGAGTLQLAGVNSLINKLVGLNATTIVDPAQKETWQMIAPTYTCTVTLDGQEEPVVLEASRGKPGGQGYIRVAGAEPEMIYNINRFDFGQVFPDGSKYLDLAATNIDADAITEVALSTPGGASVFTKTDGTWRINQPKVDLAAEGSAVESVASGIAGWKPADYADSLENTGLDAPERTITVQTASGDKHVFEIGAEAAHIEGRYARARGGDTAYVMSKTDLDRIFVQPKDIFERGIFDIDEDNVTHIEVTKGEASFTLDKSDSGWTIKQDDATFDGDPGRVEDYTFALAIFEAEDFIIGDVRVQGGFLGSVAFTMADGTSYAFNVEVEQDGRHPVTVRGKDGVAFLVNKAEIERIFPDIAKLTLTKEDDESEMEIGDTAEVDTDEEHNH